MGCHHRLLYPLLWKNGRGKRHKRTSVGGENKYARPPLANPLQEECEQTCFGHDLFFATKGWLFRQEKFAVGTGMTERASVKLNTARSTLGKAMIQCWQ
jgi:hypothetical protein